MLGGWLASTVVGTAVGATVVMVVVVVGGDVIVVDDVDVTSTAAVVEGGDASGGSDTRSAVPAALPHPAINQSAGTSHA